LFSPCAHGLLFPIIPSIYLSYSLPLTLLAAVAIVATARRQPGTYVLSAVVGFYLLFGVVMLREKFCAELSKVTFAPATTEWELSEMVP